ncbi:MAG: hypothetical protein JO327_01485 [Nitrososphaeraceae archaeon]|nr:hypothetical protein [Nitrososphaeraceae archaeon]MBV9666781.1 hypothetical protein [Nitrososphaeraceae archaeon]
MNKTTNSSILIKTLFIIIAVVAITAIALIGSGAFKAVHARQLPQPGLATSSTEVKPQPKITATSLPEEQTRQFKAILNGCSTEVNAHTPDINKLQSCDQKMSSMLVQCDKNQIDHSICNNPRLQDYMNKRGNSNP